MIVLTIFSVALLIALICTPAVRRIGLHFGWIDCPGERKLHHQPIVRVGGIAIAGGFFAGLGLIQLSYTSQLSSAEISTLISIGLGAVGFFAIGLADDLLNLHPLVRLLLQAGVTALVWNLGLQVKYVPVPWWGAISTGSMSLPITFFWLAGVANAINWLDGMDGLAAGITVIASLALTLICLHLQHPILALVTLALAGATLGFLPYNLSPAKIFMGDGGSYLIGFVLAAISAVGMMQEQAFTTNLLPFAVLLVPIFDMIFVIGSRLLTGKSPFFADQRHLHHRLLNMGCSRPVAVLSIYGLMLSASVGAILLSRVSLGWLGITSSLLLFGLTTVRLQQKMIQLRATQNSPAVSG